MKLLSLLTLALVWLTIICSSSHTQAQVGGLRGCCTAFSKPRVVNFIARRGGKVQCRQQSITQGCNLTAVVLRWKRRQVCVDPSPRKMRKHLAVLCVNTKGRKGGEHPGRPHRRKMR